MFNLRVRMLQPISFFRHNRKGKMNLSTQKTVANGTRLQRKVVFRFLVPDDFLHQLRTRAASAYVDVQVASGTDEGTPVSLSLGYIPATTGDPCSESF